MISAWLFSAILPEAVYPGSSFLFCFCVMRLPRTGRHCTPELANNTDSETKKQEGPNLSDTANGPLARRTACNTEEEADVCPRRTETHAHTQLLRVYKSSACMCRYECDQRMHLSTGGVSRLTACKVSE